MLWDRHAVWGSMIELLGLLGLLGPPTRPSARLLEHREIRALVVGTRADYIGNAFKTFTYGLRRDRFLK